MYTEETERSQDHKFQFIENRAIAVAHDVVILVVRAVFILAAEVGMGGGVAVLNLVDHHAIDGVQVGDFVFAIVSLLINAIVVLAVFHWCPIGCGPCADEAVRGHDVLLRNAQKAAAADAAIAH